MKKISLVLLGLLALTAFASAGVLSVLLPKTGTQEYFGVAKAIHPAGISWCIGVTYKNGDYLKFTLPDGWKFGTPQSGGYYLITRSNGSGNFLADFDGNALTEWSFFTGGPGQQTITFRVTDVINSLFNNATIWFLSTVSSMPLPAFDGDDGGGLIMTLNARAVADTLDFVPSTKTWFDLNSERRVIKSGSYNSATVIDGFFTATPGGSIPVVVPPGPSFGSGGLFPIPASPIFVPDGFEPGGQGYDITVEAIDGINNSVRFDGTPVGARIFTCYPEFMAALTPWTATIDVALNRMGFDAATRFGGPYRTGGLKINLTRNTGLDYFVNPLSATEYFRNTVTGPMDGVAYAKFYETQTAPSSSTSAVVDVPGDVPSFTAAGSAVMIVNGMTVLANRTFSDEIKFVNGIGHTWWTRTLLDATPANFQTWITNGTVFRSVMFATALNAGQYSAFRIANHSANEAAIYAEVWLDDGQHSYGQIGTIPAMGKISIHGWDLAHNAGCTPDLTLGAAGGWRGRCVITVWAPADTTFGTTLYLDGAQGYTEVSLEKQTNMGWWEK